MTTETTAAATSEKSKRAVKDDQKTKLLTDLVTAFGEGSVRSRAEIKKLWEKNRANYPHYAFIRKSPDYRVARNAYIVTAAETVEGVRKARDLALKTWVAPVKEVKAKAPKTPKAAKKSAGSGLGIAAELLAAGLTAPEKKSAKKKGSDPALTPVTVDDASTLGNDSDSINDILNVVQG